MGFSVKDRFHQGLRVPFFAGGCGLVRFDGTVAILKLLNLAPGALIVQQDFFPAQLIPLECFWVFFSPEHAVVLRESEKARALSCFEVGSRLDPARRQALLKRIGHLLVSTGHFAI